MPVVYNLGQHGAPPYAISPSLLPPPRYSSSASSSSLSWLGVTSPWLCGAVLVVAVLLIRHKRGTRSRGVSMSQSETLKPKKSPTPSQRSSDDRLRPEKDAFSTTSSSWSPTVATVMKYGPHSSGTSATLTTSPPMRSLFPYPNPPSPTLSLMSEENDERESEIPALQTQSLQPQPSSPSTLQSASTGSEEGAATATATATATAAVPSPLPAPPRRRSYTKTSTVPISPAKAYTFPITADESDFKFGTGADPNAPPLVMGIELAEEVIIAAEGWRRHTRVYGGGVCRACEESEEQMRQLGVKPVETDA